MGMRMSGQPMPQTTPTPSPLDAYNPNTIAPQLGIQTTPEPETGLDRIFDAYRTEIDAQADQRVLPPGQTMGTEPPNLEQEPASLAPTDTGPTSTTVPGYSPLLEEQERNRQAVLAMGGKPGQPGQPGQPGMIPTEQTQSIQTTKGIEVPGVEQMYKEAAAEKTKAYEQIKDIKSQYAALYQNPELKSAIDQRQQMFADLQKAGLNRNEILQDVANQYREARNKFENVKKIDPNRVWNEKNIGKTLMGAIGVMLGAIGSGITGKDNLALKIFNEKIKQDIDLQKYDREQALKDLQKKGEFLNQEAAIQNQMVENYLDMYLQRSKNVEGILERLKTQTQNKEDQAKINILMGQVKESNAQALTELYKLKADKTVASAVSKKVNAAMLAKKAGGIDTKQANFERALAKDYTKDAEPFYTVVNQKKNLEKLLNMKTGVADKTAIMSVAKMMDPGGRITEGDVNYWGLFGSGMENLGNRVRNIYYSDKWTDSQRVEFINALKILNNAAQARLEETNKYYKAQARRYQIPDSVFGFYSPAGVKVKESRTEQSTKLPGIK